MEKKKERKKEVVMYMKERSYQVLCDAYWGCGWAVMMKGMDEWVNPIHNTPQRLQPLA